MSYSPPNIPHPQRARRSKAPLVIGCIATPVVMLVLVFAVGVSWWSMERAKANKDMAEQTQKVRLRGEPVTLAELDAYYTAAPDRPDMTREILDALALCESPHLNPVATNLPIVGTAANIPKIPEPPQAWEQLEAVEMYLAELQPALDTLHQVRQRNATARYPTDLSQGISANLSHVQSMRHAARILSLECHVHLHRGRPHEAVDSMLALLTLAGTMDQELCLVSHLVNIAIRGIAHADLQLALKVAHIDDDDLKRLQQALRRFQVERSLQRAFIGERATGYAACLDPKSLQTPGGYNPQSTKDLAARVSRVHDAALMLRLQNQIIEAGDEGLVESLGAAREVEAELKALTQNKTKRLLYLVTLLTMPASEAATQAFARSAAQRDCADAALASELYRRQHGTWPPTLGDLVPDFLPAVPIDPFSGRSLILISTPDELKVYTVGPNGKDDGGDNSNSNGPDFAFILKSSAE